ncbi:hypothetical protein ACIPYQ_40660 [Streptomyces sp. NPDC090045]|uniref:hypothetical protein n=1 Tax=Streptomyces sp. NPDC090045 TaxID=3365927 RepID=UPI0037FBC4A1
MRRGGSGRIHGQPPTQGFKNSLGKDPDRAAERAAQLTAIDEDWDCPWPLDRQRHYRVLANLVDADGVHSSPLEASALRRRHLFSSGP